MAHFEVNHPIVVAEILEGEAIIMHLGTGTYYSLDQVGAEIWVLLSNGYDVTAVSQIIQTRYEGDSAAMDRAIQSLVEELVQANLLRPSASQHATPPTEPPHHAPKSPFVVPTLNIYTDLQDLLLVDPIHDVDPDAGWPQSPSE